MVSAITECTAPFVAQLGLCASLLPLTVQMLLVVHRALVLTEDDDNDDDDESLKYASKSSALYSVTMGRQELKLTYALLLR